MSKHSDDEFMTCNVANCVDCDEYLRGGHDKPDPTQLDRMEAKLDELLSKGSND